jgi:hypothetical protein
MLVKRSVGIPSNHSDCEREQRDREIERVAYHDANYLL